MVKEVGSMTPQGADSPIVLRCIDRVVSCLPAPQEIPHSELIDITLRNSFLVSVDNAHSVHPNYSFFCFCVRVFILS